MLLKKIYLENFRSYPKKIFEFNGEITLVVGPNTAGKSNLMESIFLLAFGTSPWATLDQEMLRGGAKLGFVRAAFEGGDKRELEVILTGNGKRFRVNGVGRRLSDFSQHFHAVLFSPQDLNLVTGAPDLRRRFVDFALGSTSLEYARTLREYEKVRKRRNRLLEQIKKSKSSEDELGFWDAKLLEYGVPLQDSRKEFFDEVNGDLRTERLELSYILSGLTAERLRDSRTREIAAETSLIGPHRDDFSFFSGERDLSGYGSRGEQRRAVLVLKRAELGYVERRIGYRPLLLLDDIFSELDKKNRAGVFELIDGGQGQVIITTANPEQVPTETLRELRVIEL
ncbi:DNA replication and repair protein RecF [Candidatus Saccharibacteria bacterium]|nr:DNA replication and repair protein RecF [Candidatus Saccharibacteria bacterium]